jgi:hypothetical protein
MKWLLLSILARSASGSTDSILESASFVCDYSSNSDEVILYDTSSGLDTFVGFNVLQQLLYDPECNFDSACFDKYMGEIIAGFLYAGLGLFFALALLIGFLIFSPCLCSRRYRQWRGWKRFRERSLPVNFSIRVSRLLMSITILIFVGMVIDIAIASQGKVKMDSSFDDALCQSYKFFNETLYGGSATAFEYSFGYEIDAQFPGLYSAVDVLQNITVLLEPGGSLRETMDNLMSLMNIVDEQFVLMQSVYENLNTVMIENFFAEDHFLLFAQNYSFYQQDIWGNHPNHPSMVAINNSMAGVVNLIRAELLPFTGNDLQVLYDTMNETQSGLNNFIDELVKIINEAALSNINAVYDWYLIFDICIIVCICLVILPVGLGLFSVHKGLRVSRRTDDFGDPNIVPTSPRVASIPLWITFVYTFFMFISSGVVMIGANISASVCLIMEDIGSVASEMSFRFGSDEVATEIVSVVQECLQANTDGDILSAIIIDGSSTARDKIQSLTVLSGEFQTIQNAIDAGQTNTNLTGNIYLSNMGRYLASVGSLFLMTQDQQDILIQTSPYYKPRSNSAIFSTDYNTGLSVWHETASMVPECEERTVLVDQTPVGIIPYLSFYNFTGTSYIIGGVSDLIDVLNSYDVSTGVTSCPSATYATENLVPWGNLENVKLKLIQSHEYRCDSPLVLYNSDSDLYFTGAVYAMCNSTEFIEYMETYYEVINNQSTNVDNVVAENFEAIFDDLWSVVYDNLMEPAEWIGETMNCQFVSVRWNALFQSACVGLVPSLITIGKTFLAFGLMGFFLLVIQIIVWRHLVDNFSLWQEFVKRNPKTGLIRRVSSFTEVEIKPIPQSSRSCVGSFYSINPSNKYSVCFISDNFSQKQDSRIQQSE